MQHDPDRHVAIVGGGPAGLTAGYLLAKEGWRVSVFESDGHDLGGLSRTVSHKGFRFDLGGHRFESRSAAVTDFWAAMLGRDLIERPRQTRICYRGRIFPYPRSAAEVLPKLGLREAARCGLSYLRARLLRPNPAPGSFEEWAADRFGERLSRLLFGNYADKSWPGAAEPSREAGATFRYPRLGPGQMWERCAEEIRALGGSVYLGHSVMSMEQTFDRAWTVAVINNRGREVRFRAQHVISTTDLRELIHMIQPAVSSQAALAASSLRYRDFLSVALIVRDFRNLPDQTVDLYDPELKAARLQNFKAWSPEMVPDPAYACYGLEYFRPKEDKLWDADDRRLIEFAAGELEATGIARASQVEDGFVVRQEKACPEYDGAYEAHMRAIRRDVAARYPGLHLAGRNGMHRSHDLDQAMLTAMQAARNIACGENACGENRDDAWDLDALKESPRPQASQPTAAPASSSGLRLVSNRTRTAEQLSALDKRLSAFRGPSPSAVGVFQVHAGGGSGKHKSPDDSGEDGNPPPSAA